MSSKLGKNQKKNSVHQQKDPWCAESFVKNSIKLTKLGKAKLGKDRLGAALLEKIEE